MVDTKPILFSGAMVRAILEGRKTQTRRIIKHTKPIVKVHPPSSIEPDIWMFDHEKPGKYIIDHSHIKCLYGQLGSLLWVRETWQLHEKASDLGKVVYKASERGCYTNFHELVDVKKIGNMQAKPFQNGWKPSIHMPRWANRITLEVKNIRAERLQDISCEDSLSEGCICLESKADYHGGYTFDETVDDGFGSPISAFEELWESINGAESWDSDLWVWVIDFKPHICNVDEYLKRKKILRI